MRISIDLLTPREADNLLSEKHSKCSRRPRAEKGPFETLFMIGFVKGFAGLRKHDFMCPPARCSTRAPRGIFVNTRQLIFDTRHLIFDTAEHPNNPQRAPENSRELPDRESPRKRNQELFEFPLSYPSRGPLGGTPPHPPTYPFVNAVAYIAFGYAWSPSCVYCPCPCLLLHCSSMLSLFCCPRTPL